MKNVNIKKIRKKLEKTLDPKRYEHTLGVAYTAAALAMCSQADIEKAKIAGLLHDCAKCMSNEKKIAVCQKQGIEITEIEKKNPFLLHAKVGSYLARKQFHVKDEDILNAILNHTTGRPGMSRLEKIIYIADITEAGRDFEGVDELRRLVDKDLTAAIIKSVEFELKRNSQRQSIIHPNMIYMWNDIVLNRD